MKTHKLAVHFRNNDIIFFKKVKYSKQACYTFKFHSEIKIWLKPWCQQTTCITNKTCDAIKIIIYISLTNEIENSRTNILLSKKYNNGICELFQFEHANFQSCTSCPKCRRIFDYYEVCQLFTWILSSKYPVYTLIRYANKHGFFPLKLKKWFGVLQEYPIINNILLYDIRIGGIDCIKLNHQE